MPLSFYSLAKACYTTKDAITAGLLGMIEEFGIYSVNEKLKKACNSISLFIKKPNIISISIKPDKAIEYTTVYNTFTEQTFDALNFKIETR